MFGFHVKKLSFFDWHNSFVDRKINSFIFSYILKEKAKLKSSNTCQIELLNMEF